MLKSYLTTALRNLSRQKAYTLINISGLAIGLATCMLIMIYIVHELSYDRFFDKQDRIYRVAVNASISGDFLEVAVTSNPMAEAMVNDLPEVLSSTRILPDNQSALFAIEGKRFYNEGIYYVDSTFLDIFSYVMVSGDPETALDEPYSIILSQSQADKYFPGESAIGKMIRMNDRMSLKVTAVMEDPPDNSHLNFNCLISYSTLLSEYGAERYDNWGSLSIYTYLLLSENADPAKLEAKFNDFIYRHMEDLSENTSIFFELYLQELSSIHLRSNLMAEIGPNSDIRYIFTFGAIAFFALLIACINFMNLATARSQSRAREVGMRKVCGAHRNQIIVQFLGESILLATFSMIMAILMVELALPLFNNLTGLKLGFASLFTPLMILGMVLLLLVVGIFAGSYPAFYMSAFQPISAIKGMHSRHGRSKPHLRNILVIFQFSISIILIICTIIVFLQMDFLGKKDLGFEKENVMIIPLRSERLREKIKVYDLEFTSLNEVNSVSFSSGLPGRNLNGTGFVPEGMDEDSPWIIYHIECDFGFINSLGMNLLYGRDFDPAYSTDTNCVIINETLMHKLAWDEPLGKHIQSFGEDDSLYGHKIIGVIEDFHFKSLHEPVEPSLIMLNTSSPDFMIIRMKPGDISKNIEAIREKWEDIESSFIFDYFLMDSQFEELYRSDRSMGRLFLYFAIIAIFIACLGLFGLASYTAEQRTKEIGIRKVLGASSRSIVIRLSLEFTRWVLIANIIAWPLAWLLMDRWLENFAYSINWQEFLWVLPASTIISFIVALATVSSQALRAALTDPVRALQYE